MAKGEIIDRIISYGTPAVLLIKKLLESAVKNPEIQKAATDKIIEIAKGGKTRSDELIFFASLISLVGIKEETKLLFLKKHREMLDPVFTGKNPADVKKLRRKMDRAKGLVFLIAEDETANEKKQSDKYVFANKVWYGIFLGIEKCPNDTARLAIIEKRIIHFGKNNQEGITAKELAERTGTVFSKVLSSQKENIGKISTELKKIPTITNKGLREVALPLARRSREYREKSNWKKWLLN